MKKLLLFLLWVPVLSFAQNVGIGTTTPAARLDVKAASNYVAQFNGGSSMYMGIFENDLYRGYWGSYSGNPEDVDFGTGSGTTGKLHLTIQGNPQLTVNNVGQVGIGTTTPAYILDVANRMRLRTGTLDNIFTTPGIWYDDYRDGTERIFTGMQDSVRWGIYGGGTGGVGWGVNFNAKTGNVNVGNSVQDFYRMNLTGSDYGMGLYSAGGSFYGNMYKSSADDLIVGAAYGNVFAGTPAKNILLNPPGSLFLFSGNVGVNTNTPNARLHVGGNAYIGTTSGTPAAGYQLSVKGKIISEEVKVQLSASWPDYVFSDDYKLPDLADLEKYIITNKHLPNIPAAADIEKNGFELGDMQRRSIEKIEELTLLMLQMNKQNIEMKQKMEQMEKEIQALKKNTVQ
jgi:hypothetical protein